MKQRAGQHSLHLVSSRKKSRRAPGPSVSSRTPRFSCLPSKLLRWIQAKLITHISLPDRRHAPNQNSHSVPCRISYQFYTTHTARRERRTDSPRSLACAPPTSARSALGSALGLALGSGAPRARQESELENTPIHGVSLRSFTRSEQVTCARIRDAPPPALPPRAALPVCLSSRA